MKYATLVRRSETHFYIKLPPMKKRTFTLLSFLLLIGTLSAQEISIPEQQRSLVMKHTATWCPPCGATAWDVFEALVNDYEQEAVFLQVHISGSSLFYSENASDLLDNCDRSFFQPEFFHNTIRIGSGSGSTQADMAALVEAQGQAAPVAQTGIRFTYDPGSRQLDVQTNTRFFSAAEGNYYLSLFLAYREVDGFQENRGQGQRHKHVLKKALTSDTFGELLLSGNIEAGTEKGFNLTTTLPDDMDIATSEITAVLWKSNEEGAYDFVNVNLQQTLSEMTTSRVDPEQGRAGFTVAPTIVRDKFNIDLDLPRAFQQVDITMFNLLGQPVRPLFRGPVEAGRQQMYFNRPGQVTSGIYLLRMTAGKVVVTRRVIFR